MGVNFTGKCPYIKPPSQNVEMLLCNILNRLISTSTGSTVTQQEKNNLFFTSAHHFQFFFQELLNSSFSPWYFWLSMINSCAAGCALRAAGCALRAVFVSFVNLCLFVGFYLKRGVFSFLGFKQGCYASSFICVRLWPLGRSLRA